MSEPQAGSGVEGDRGSWYELAERWGLFVPIGLVSSVARSVPGSVDELADRGRTEVGHLLERIEMKVRTARVVGQFAAPRVRQVLSDRVDERRVARRGPRPGPTPRRTRSSSRPGPCGAAPASSWRTPARRRRRPPSTPAPPYGRVATGHRAAPPPRPARPAARAAEAARASVAAAPGRPPIPPATSDAGRGGAADRRATTSWAPRRSSPASRGLAPAELEAVRRYEVSRPPAPHDPDADPAADHRDDDRARPASSAGGPVDARVDARARPGGGPRTSRPSWGSEPRAPSSRPFRGGGAVGGTESLPSRSRESYGRLLGVVRRPRRRGAARRRGARVRGGGGPVPSATAVA